MERLLLCSYFCLTRCLRPFLGVDAVDRLCTLTGFWRSSGEPDIYSKPDLNRSSLSAALSNISFVSRTNSKILIANMYRYTFSESLYI